jgi:hypothetical protein
MPPPAVASQRDERCHRGVTPGGQHSQDQILSDPNFDDSDITGPYEWPAGSGGVR